MSVLKAGTRDNSSVPDPVRRDFLSIRLLLLAVGTSTMFAMLFYLWENPGSAKGWMELFSFAGIVILIMALCLFVKWRSVAARKEVRKVRPAVRDILFLLSLIVLLLVVVKGVFDFVAAAPTIGVFADSSIYAYLIPISALAMVVRILINFETCVLFIVAASVLATATVSGRWPELLFLLLSGTAGACGTAVADRYKMLKATAITAPVCAIAAGALEYVFSDGGLAIPAFIVGAVNGLIAGPIALAILPVAELVFGYASDIRLLELSSTSRPILSGLMVCAPGTYRHSIAVGTLAEAAAHAIGANPVLCRVAALYHDIGKMGKAQYYSENQVGTENVHDMLSPGLSRTVILSHVKEGVRMAREAGLGDRVIEIIEQHHGTSLLYYFLDKAKPMIQNKKASEEMFRYPGPRPRTREAAIVMIADATEAAVCSLKNPSAQEVEEIVTGIINRVYLDEQLNECEMELRDLHAIGKAMSRMLVAFVHRRVDYPASGKGLADEET